MSLLSPLSLLSVPVLRFPSRSRSSSRHPGRRRPWAATVVGGAGVGFVAVAVAGLVALSAGIGSGQAASAYTRTWTAHHQPAANPVLAPGCGLDVGLLIDRSGSIANAGAQEHMRSAARGVVEALTGTPSRVGVWSFGNVSAAGPGDPAHPAIPLTEIGGPRARDGQAAIVAVIDSIPFTGSEATNWDSALRAVHEASLRSGSAPDLLLVLTDGQPTVFGDAPRLDPFTEDVDIDAGIISANLVKADGTRIFALGIGAEIDTAALSLISGGTPWNGSNIATADYAVTSFDALGATLRAAVSDLCGGTVTVQKVLRDGSGGEGPAAGWTFVLDGDRKVPWATSAVTDESGIVQFAVPGVDAERVTIGEVSQPGVDLVVADITCDNSSGRQPVLEREAEAVSFDLGPTDVVSCTFPNRVQPEPEPSPSTTTTTATPTTSSTVPDEASPTTTTPPSTPPSTTTPSTVPGAEVPAGPPPAGSAPVTVLAAVQEPVWPATLPRTGTDTGRLAFAAGCLVFGGLLVTLGLRRAA